jgi:hypothetical protein
VRAVLTSKGVTNVGLFLKQFRRAWNLYVGDPTMDENAHDQRASYGFQFRPPVSSVILLRKAEALPSVGGAAGVFFYGRRGHANVLRYAATERAVRNFRAPIKYPSNKRAGIW